MSVPRHASQNSYDDKYDASSLAISSKTSVSSPTGSHMSMTSSGSNELPPLPRKVFVSGSRPRPSITIHAVSPMSVSLASEMALKSQSTTNIHSVSEESTGRNYTITDDVPMQNYVEREAITIRSVIDISDYGVNHGIPAMDVVATSNIPKASSYGSPHWRENEQGAYEDDYDSEDDLARCSDEVGFSYLPVIHSSRSDEIEAVNAVSSRLSNSTHLGDTQVNARSTTPASTTADSKRNQRIPSAASNEGSQLHANVLYAPGVVLVDDDSVYTNPLPQLKRGHETCSDSHSDSHDVSTRDVSNSVSRVADQDHVISYQPKVKERIVVAKQDFSDLGEIKIDRHGRIRKLSTKVDDKFEMQPSHRSTRNSILMSFVSNATATKEVHLDDARYKERDVQRETKWIDMLSNWISYTTKKRDILKKRIRKGIPASLRGVVWPSLVGITEAQASMPVRYYHDLLQQDLDEANDLQIRKDLPRMSQDHVMFRSPEAGSRVVMCHGQASLYNVLKAYAIHDTKVGYVQGMDSVAVAALLYFPEETAFWYLERMLNNPIYNLRDLYVDGMPLAHKYMYIHAQLVRKYVPKVHAILVKHDIMPMSYAFRWYSMRFSQFDPTLSYRILDIYLYEGDKILYRVALALLLLREAEICAAEQADEVMQILVDIERDQTWHAEDQGDVIIDKAISISVRTDDIIKYSRRYAESEKERYAIYDDDHM